MRALLYLLTLTLCCFLKNGYCVNKNFEEFKKDARVTPLLAQYHNRQIKREGLLTKLNNIGHGMPLNTLKTYLKQIKEAGGGYRKSAFEQFKNDPRAMDLVEQFKNNKMTNTQLLEALKQINHKMSINAMHFFLDRLNEEKADGCGYRKDAFEQFKDDPRAMDLVEQFNNKQITNTELLEALKQIKYKMCIQTMYKYLKKLKDEKADGGGYRKDAFEQFKNDPRAMDLVEQFNNKQITNTELLEALKQIKYKMCLQTMYKYLKKLKDEKNKGKSTNLSKESNSDNWSLSSITGSAPHYGDAMPSQQVPPMDDTFVPFQAGTDSWDWSGENLQSNDGDLYSVVRPKNTSSSASEGFDTTPFLLNQLQSTGWPGTSNYFSPTPNTSNFTSGNPGSSAMPSQQVPMPDTSLAFPNDPFNQSAQLNSSTNFVPSQTETHSLDWSGGNSQNNEGTLESMFNTRNPSSEKTGKRSI